MNKKIYHYAPISPAYIEYGINTHYPIVYATIKQALIDVGEI